MKLIDPWKDLPKCDICGAVFIGFTMEMDDSRTSKARMQLTFACGAKFVTSCRTIFNQREWTTDGPFTPYEAISDWTESDQCTNAAFIARQQRDQEAYWKRHGHDDAKPPGEGPDEAEQK